MNLDRQESHLDEGAASAGHCCAAGAGDVAHHALGVDGNVGEAEEHVPLLAVGLQVQNTRTKLVRAVW